MPMVLLQRLTITELNGTPRTLPVSMTHRRQLPPYVDGTIVVGAARVTRCSSASAAGAACCSPSRARAVRRRGAGREDYQRPPAEADRRHRLRRPASQGHPPVRREAAVATSCSSDDAATLTAIDYAKARAATLKFWSRVRRARRAVPRARSRPSTSSSAPACGTRSGCRAVTAEPEPDVAIDLPYSNFAYSQTGTPWPVNQAVYVDYMLYDLRGYHAIAAEELEAQFRNNQEADGHVERLRQLARLHAGDALRGRAELPALERPRRLRALLPPGLKAMDWCLAQMARSRSRRGAGAGPRPRPAQRPDRAGRLGVQPGVPLRGARSLRARARAARPPARRRGASRPPARFASRSRAASAPPACDRRSSSCATAPGCRTCRPRRSRRGACSTSGTPRTSTPAPSTCCG